MILVVVVIVVVHRRQEGTRVDLFADVDEDRGDRSSRRAVDAVRILRIGVEHLPDRVKLLERLARILATSPDDALRNGTEALSAIGCGMPSGNQRVIGHSPAVTRSMERTHRS